MAARGRVALLDEHVRRRAAVPGRADGPVVPAAGVAEAPAALPVGVVARSHEHGADCGHDHDAAGPSPSGGVLIGRADDPAEAEADRVADQVVGLLRRSSAPAAAGGSNGNVAGAAVAPAVAALRRRGAPADDPLGGTRVAGLEGQLSGGGGAALPPALLPRLEGAFGTPLDHVRVHTDSKADGLARSVQSVAFTRGSDIWFSKGSYDPGSASGQHLLAHELTHVVQGGTGAQRTTAPLRRRGDPDLAKAKKAHRAAEKALAAAEKELARATRKGEDTTSAANAVTAAKSDLGTKAQDLIVQQKKGRDSKYATLLEKQSGRLDALKTGLGIDDNKTGQGRFGGHDVTDGKKTQDEGDVAVDTLETLTGKGGSIGMAHTDQKDALLSLKGGSKSLSAEDKKKYDEEMKPYGQAASGIGLGTDVLGLIGMIKTFAQSEKSKKEIAEFGLGLGTKAVSMTSKTLKLIGSTIDDEGLADRINLASIGLNLDFINKVKDTFVQAKALYTTFKAGAKATNESKARESFATAAKIAATGKSAVEMIKGVLSAVNSLSGPAIASAHAMPGMGIALGTAEIIVRTFDLFEAWELADGVRMQKQDMKATFGGVAGRSAKKKAEEIAADPTNPRQQEAVDYLHFKGLQYVQEKNARRAMLSIGIAITEVAGDAATLGGASAPVGMGIKLVALVTSLGSKILRNVKQFGRDQVDKSRTKRKDKILNDTTITDENVRNAKLKEVDDAKTIFNLNKTSGKKLQGYKDTVTRVLNRVAAYTPVPGTGQTVDDKRLEWMKVVHEFEATGLRMHEAEAILGKGENLGIAMVKALQRREK